MGRYAAWLLTIEDTYYNDGTPIINKEFVEEQLEKGADPSIRCIHDELPLSSAIKRKSGEIIELLVKKH